MPAPRDSRDVSDMRTTHAKPAAACREPAAPNRDRRHGAEVAPQPLPDESADLTDNLMPPPCRDDFERWYATSDARWWNASDAMFTAWQAAIAAERERCAKIADGYTDDRDYNTALYIAKEIRAGR